MALGRVNPAAQGAMVKRASGGGGGAPEAPQRPQIDPRFKQLQEAQQRAATDFRREAPSLVNRQMEYDTTSSRRNLAGSINANRAGFSSRGLLYSGLRQGAEQDLADNSASQLAARRQELNRSVEDQASALEDKALNTSLEIGRMGGEMDDRALQAALAQRGERRKALGDLGSAFGGVAGMALGGSQGAGSGYGGSSPKNSMDAYYMSTGWKK